MIVRLATESDLPAILDMGAKFHAFSGESVPYCRQSAESSARSIMVMGFVLVAEDGGKLVGMLGVLVAPLFFNFAHTMAQELMWWVDEDERGSGAALRLIRAAEHEARNRGVSRLNMAHLANSPPHVSAIYARLGYTPRESMFCKEF